MIRINEKQMKYLFMHYVAFPARPSVTVVCRSYTPSSPCAPCTHSVCIVLVLRRSPSAASVLKGIHAKFQVIRGFSQKIPADLLSYDKIHS